MTGIEIAIGCLITWLVKKANRAGQRADAEVDYAIDAGMDKLHDLVTAKLGPDTALAALTTEVTQTGTATARTQQRVHLSLDEAAEHDPNFATQLHALIEQIQATQAQTGSGVYAHDEGIAVVGNVHLRAERGSATALRIGNVSLGGSGERPDPHQPGQPSS